LLLEGKVTKAADFLQAPEIQMRWSSELSAGLKMHAHYMIAEPSSLLVMMASLYSEAKTHQTVSFYSYARH